MYDITNDSLYHTRYKLNRCETKSKVTLDVNTSYSKKNEVGKPIQPILV